MLNQLLDKFRPKIIPPEMIPLGSLSATHKWVSQLQLIHEYEAHQQVVIVLDTFNRAQTPFDIQQLHILGAIEHFGSKLQYGLITQFLKNHADYKYAGKSLWHEIVAFYWQLAQAYQSMTNAILHDRKAHASALPTLVLRALHYQGKLIQWRYLRYELPTPQTWHALHKLYKIAEHHGFAKQSMVLKGSAYCSCEQAYARILLLHLMRPVGLTPNEIELAAYWAWKWRETISLTRDFDISQHNHYIALSDSLPPQSLNGQAIAEESIRYWSIQGVMAQMENFRANLGSSNTRLIKLYGVTFADSPDTLLHHIQVQLTSVISLLDTSVFTMPGTVNISCGKAVIMDALRTPGSSKHIAASYQATGHPSEAYYRLSIAAGNPSCRIKAHDLLISYDEDITHIQTLAAVRWLEESPSATLTLGMERLGFLPLILQLHPLQDALAPSVFSQSAPHLGLPVIAEAHASTLVSFQTLQHSFYDMREEDFIYRIRILTVLEQKPGWMRVQFARLTRRYLPV